MLESSMLNANNTTEYRWSLVTYLLREKRIRDDAGEKMCIILYDRPFEEFEYIFSIEEIHTDFLILKCGQMDSNGDFVVNDSWPLVVGINSDLKFNLCPTKATLAASAKSN